MCLITQRWSLETYVVYYYSVTDRNCIMETITTRKIICILKVEQKNKVRIFFHNFIEASSFLVIAFDSSNHSEVHYLCIDNKVMNFVWFNSTNPTNIYLINHSIHGYRSNFQGRMIPSHKINFSFTKGDIIQEKQLLTKSKNKNQKVQEIKNPKI